MADLEQMMDKADKLLDYGEFKKAQAVYEKALESIPAPQTEHELYLELMAALADAVLCQEKYRDAEKIYKKIMTHPDAAEHGFLHLRYGQIAMELGNDELAAAELKRAYELGGEELFEDEPEEILEIARG